MSDSSNTTSRSELVDRIIRVENIALSAFMGDEYYNGNTNAQDMARDILSAIKGNVTVTEQGIPPT